MPFYAVESKSVLANLSLVVVTYPQAGHTSTQWPIVQDIRIFAGQVLVAAEFYSADWVVYPSIIPATDHRSSKNGIRNPILQ